MVRVHALECIQRMLDHASIHLTTGTPRPPCTRKFKLELGWLHRKGFHDMIKKHTGNTCYKTVPNQEVE
jgi:hypothetical protein